jgi:hypothetical protein
VVLEVKEGVVYKAVLVDKEEVVDKAVLADKALLVDKAVLEVLEAKGNPLSVPVPVPVPQAVLALSAVDLVTQVLIRMSPPLP